MPEEKILETAVDTWINEAAPNKNYGDSAALYLSSTAGSRRFALVYFTRPVPPGASIGDSDLRVRLRGAWPVGTILSAQRIVKRWYERKATWSSTFGAGGFVAGPVVNVTLTAAGPDGGTVLVPLEAILADVSAGGAWFGLLLSVSVAGPLRLHSAEASLRGLHPDLIVNYAAKPGKATNLRPSGNRIVSDVDPTLSYEPRLDPSATLVNQQIRIYDGANALVHDSGVIATTEARYDLSSVAYAIPANAAGYSWEVRYQDSYGAWSDYSDRASFGHTALGVLTIGAPAAAPNNWTDDHTAPITTTLSRAQARIEHALYRIEADGSRTLVHREPMRAAPANAATAYTWNLPPGLLAELQPVEYEIEVISADTLDREPLPDAPSVVVATRRFTFRTSAGVAGVTPGSFENLTPTNDASPGILLEWERNPAPDEFVLRMDGVEVARHVAGDLLVGGTTYRLRYYGAPPAEEVTLSVEAVVNGVSSSVNPALNVTLVPVGTWLVGVEDEIEVVFLEDTISDAIGEDSEIHVLSGRQDPVLETGEIRGDEGTVSGLVVPYLGVSGREWRDRIYELKAIAGETEVRLVSSDRNYPVLIGATSVPKVDDYLDTYAPSVEFLQVGEFRIPSVRAS